MVTENITINTDDIILFDISTESYIEIKEDDYQENPIGIGCEVLNDLEDKNLKIVLSFKIEHSNGSFAKFETSCFFHINNEKQYLIEYEQEEIFHPQLITTLVSVAYSTSRGIIFEKMKNTHWKDFILPVVSPLKLLEQDR